jgi:hypothetical protein
VRTGKEYGIRVSKLEAKWEVSRSEYALNPILSNFSYSEVYALSGELNWGVQAPWVC